MMNNDLYLTDEDIHALDEPTWEEQEIERLKKKIEELECKLEDKECCIEMAVDYIKKNQEEQYCSGLPMLGDYAIDGLLNILEVKNEFKN